MLKSIMINDHFFVFGGSIMKIMLVDDEQLIVDGLKKIIGRQFPDLEVVAYTDPVKVLESLPSNLPDLLLTDIRMPEITGLELIARAREAGVRYCAVLTGLNDVPLLQESIRLQVCDYLIKPVNKEELFALITRTRERLEREKAEQDHTLAEYFCSGEWSDSRVARELSLQARRSDCPPLTLESFLLAVGRELPFWEICRLTAEMLENRKTEEELGAELRSLPILRIVSSPEMREILSEIRRDYRRELSVSEMAARVYLQPNYFTTLFRKETGKGFVQYLNQIRIEEACRKILTEPGLSMQDVAENCGFPSLRHFFSVFKKMTAVTPGEFRKAMELAGFMRG